ncbi:Unknown protein, partial [Striga hermonthica]
MQAPRIESATSHNPRARHATRLQALLTSSRTKFIIRILKRTATVLAETELGWTTKFDQFRQHHSQQQQALKEKNTKSKRRKSEIIRIFDFTVTVRFKSEFGSVNSRFFHIPRNFSMSIRLGSHYGAFLSIDYRL